MERKFDSFVHKADTMIILHLIQAAQSTREEKVIVVRLSDTDVFLLLFRFFKKLTSLCCLILVFQTRENLLM